MKQDLTNYRRYLRAYLISRGVDISPTGDCHCPNPAHPDKHASAKYYENSNQIYCAKCHTNYDIFHCIEFYDNITDFKEKMRYIERQYNITPSSTVEATEQATVEAKTVEYKSVPENNAGNIYKPQIENLLKFIHDGKYTYADKTAHWLYKNKDGNVDLITMRFEKDGKKDVLSFWYDGAKVKSTSYPILIYRIDTLDYSKPIIWHEGEKCADYGAAILPKYNHLAWNGGSGKVKQVDFERFRNYPADQYYIADDDEPGEKCAHVFKNELGAKIIRVPKECRSIKSKGADIVEMHAILKDGIEDYILNYTDDIVPDVSQPVIQLPVEDVKPKQLPKQEIDESIEYKQYPFKILGIAEDGYAYFICDDDRLVGYKLSSLSQDNLTVLTSLDFWKQQVGTEDIKRKHWNELRDNIITLSKRLDFDVERIRGRGAWREKDGRMCYFDGRVVTGEYDSKKLFVRNVKKEVGITEQPIDKSITKQMQDVLYKTTISKKYEANQLLSWSVLSPFCGALPWRSIMFLTGESSSGKSQIYDNIIIPLSNAKKIAAKGSTEAGVSQLCGIDAVNFAIEECETKTENDKKFREAALGIARNSTSDDTPDTVKGSKEGRAVLTKRKSMFLFVAINSSVDNDADENRIFYVNCIKADKKKEDEWTETLKTINELYNDENCARVRSYVWQNLKNIIDLSYQVQKTIAKYTGYDSRMSYADALLFSAWFYTFHDGTIVEQALSEYYSDFVNEREKSSGSDDYLNKILDYNLPCGDTQYKKVPIREMLYAIRTGDDMHTDKPVDSDTLNKEYKVALSRARIKLDSDFRLVMSTDSPEIKKILGIGDGRYGTMISRGHPVYKKKSEYIDGKNRNCIIFEEKAYFTSKKELTKQLHDEQIIDELPI